MGDGYNTQHKRELLELLMGENELLTAAQIIKKLKERGSTAGDSTVYRLLSSLCNDGLIKQFKSNESKSAMYRYAGGETCKTHYHLQCAQCGRLVHLDDRLTGLMNKSILSANEFETEGDTVITGTCLNCVRKNKEKDGD